MRRKALFISIVYIIGIIGGLCLNKNVILFSFVLSLFYILCTSRSIFKVVIVFVFFISSLNVNKKLELVNKLYLYNKNTCSITGTITEKQEKNYKNKYTIKITEINNISEYEGYKLTFSSKESINLNSKVYICGNIEQYSKMRNHGCFDKKKYYLSKLIIGNVNNVVIENIRYQENNNYLVKWRLKIESLFYKSMTKKSADLCNALTFGKKENIDENIRENFSDSSLSYILAISGMHVVLISSLVFFLSKKFNKFYSYFAVIFFISLYICVVDSSESVVRAGIMIVIYYMSKIIRTKNDSLTSLAVSVCVILSINPFSIYSSGLIMSVGGTLGIIVFFPLLQAKCKRIKNKFYKYLASSVCLSISANIILLPIIAVFYNRVSFIFIISGVIAGILLEAILVSICICIVCNYISSALVIYISKFLALLTELLIYVSDFFSKFDFLVILTKSPSMVELFLYYVLCYIIYIMIKATAKDRRILKKIMKYMIVVSICVVIVFDFFSYKLHSLHIFFIDVGQGDATLIDTPKMKKILIDGGGDESESNYVGKKILLPYLLNRGIKRLDYIIISHFDTDHVRTVY